jgi:hypothetical protein
MVLRTRFPVALKTDLTVGARYGNRALGLCGNARASRVWKGEGEEIEQFWPILLTWKGLFCLKMGVDKTK